MATAIYDIPWQLLIAICLEVSTEHGSITAIDCALIFFFFFFFFFGWGWGGGGGFIRKIPLQYNRPQLRCLVRTQWYPLSHDYNTTPTVIKCFSKLMNSKTIRASLTILSDCWVFFLFLLSAMLQTHDLVFDLWSWKVPPSTKYRKPTTDMHDILHSHP